MSTQPDPQPTPDPGADLPPGLPPDLPTDAPTDAPTDLAPTPATLSTTCPACGAQTAYAPGTTSLRCSACGAAVAIAATEARITEHSYDAWRARSGSTELATIGAQVLTCRNCGATTETTDLAGTCQFCAGALVAVTHPEGLVPPEAVVPFHVDQQGARGAFSTWVGSRRFAPGALRKVGSAGALQGTYVPHWTFDASTTTDYTGQRGEHYYVSVAHRVSDGKGGHRTEHRQEQRTAWHRASGRVARAFDDVLVPGSTHLDPERLEKMGPWTLGDAVPFQAEYLTGYSALRYDVDPQAGAELARAEMRKTIAHDVERDIGGDEQRVSSMDVDYARAMFKLVLMPLWLASYVYGGRTFQVMVNANTGEVVGERPYSVPKIVAAVLAVLLLVAVIVGVVLAVRG